MPYSVISEFMPGIWVLLIITQIGPLLGHTAPAGGALGAVQALPALIARVEWREAVLSGASLLLLSVVPGRSHLSPMSSNPAARKVAPRAAAALIAVAVTLLGGCVRIPLNEDTLFQPKELVTIGTFMATYVAEQRKAAALVLENPATSARDWTRTAVPWYLRLILSFNIAESVEAEDNLERIDTVEEHLLVLAGGEDMVTPSEMAEDLHEAAAVAESSELIIIEEGSHPDLHEFDVYGTAHRRLIDRVVAEPPSR